MTWNDGCLCVLTPDGATVQIYELPELISIGRNGGGMHIFDGRLLITGQRHGYSRDQQKFLVLRGV